MKQYFEDPKMDIICLGKQDILTTSVDRDGHNTDPWG